MTNHSEKTTKDVRHRTLSTNTIRTQFRNRFNDRIKQERNNIVDSYRNSRQRSYLATENVINQSYNEIKSDILCSSEDIFDFWTTNDMLELLDSVQEELILEEMEQTVKILIADAEEELCYLLNQSTIICDICEKQIESESLSVSVICEDCAKRCFFDNVV